MPKQMEVIVYPEDGWTVDEVEVVVKMRTSVKEYAMILHDQDVDELGNPVKPHIHLYINSGSTNWKYEDVAKWFGIKANQIGPIKTKKPLVLRYFMHEGCPDKHSYPVENIVANFDVKEFLRQYTQTVSLNAMIHRCANGEITRGNYTLYINPIVFARHKREFESAWKFFDSLQAARSELRTQERSILWLYGETSVGKSLLCRLLAHERKSSVYFSSTGRDPFGEYKEEDVVVLDDLRPRRPFSFESLLKIIDPYNTCGVNARYRNKVLTCSLIIVTSPMSPEEYAKDIKSEDAAQLYRRLSEVWNVTQSDIYISKYNLKTRRFVPTATRPNPVPAYLATLSLPASTFNGGDILNILNTLYVPPAAPASSASGTGSSTSDGPSETAADNEKEVTSF